MQNWNLLEFAKLTNNDHTVQCVRVYARHRLLNIKPVNYHLLSKCWTNISSFMHLLVLWYLYLWINQTTTTKLDYQYAEYHWITLWNTEKNKWFNELSVAKKRWLLISKIVLWQKIIDYVKKSTPTNDINLTTIEALFWCHHTNFVTWMKYDAKCI